VNEATYALTFAEPEIALPSSSSVPAANSPAIVMLPLPSTPIAPV
jgi:hypothetical protein